MWFSNHKSGEPASPGQPNITASASLKLDSVRGVLLSLGGKHWQLVLLFLNRDHSFWKASRVPGIFLSTVQI